MLPQGLRQVLAGHNPEVNVDNNQYFKDAIKNQNRHPAVLAFYQLHLDGKLTTDAERLFEYNKAVRIESEYLRVSINETLEET